MNEICTEVVKHTISMLEIKVERGSQTDLNIMELLWSSVFKRQNCI